MSRDVLLYIYIEMDACVSEDKLQPDGEMRMPNPKNEGAA